MAVAVAPSPPTGLRSETFTAEVSSSRVDEVVINIFCTVKVVVCVYVRHVCPYGRGSELYVYYRVLLCLPMNLASNVMSMHACSLALFYSGLLK